MEYAIQGCCTTPEFLPQYETSIDAVFDKLGIETLKIKEFNCCGYPLKNFNFKANILASGRNLSLAEKRGLNITTFCNCCYGNLKQSISLMREDTSIRNELNRTLNKERLTYGGDADIKHFMEVLYKDIGIKEIRKKIVRSFKGIKIAVHYGCHVLRPSRIVQFDPPGTISTFNHLIEITGAEIISWQLQRECCGSPLWGVDDDLSMDLTYKKICDARRAGADYLCVACSYCQLQFDRVQKMLLERRGLNHSIPSILYSQLLGLCMGIDDKFLGISQSELGLRGIMEFLH